MIGKKFKNTSGKTVQFPLRISDDFSWTPGETITVINECKEANGPRVGYIVLNEDYCGAHIAFEKAWISKEVLNDNFTEVL